MKITLIMSILFFFGGYYFSEYNNSQKIKMEYEPKESMVLNSFKIGCEFSVMKNNLKDKAFCSDHLQNNKKLLKKLIESNKL